jgi:CMP-N-acetylneuraminic acid synthetase
MSDDLAPAKEKTLILIPARGGSKGIPRKNIRPFHGKPLIAWTIAAAFEAGVASRVLVSTDDSEIAAVSEQFGADATPRRPAEFATDTASAADVAIWTLDWLAEHRDFNPDYLVYLQPTSPLRAPSDITTPLRMLLAHPAYASVIGVGPAPHHPHWMKTIDANGALVDLLPTETEHYRARQSLPQVYCLNGAVYAVRAASLRSAHSMLPGPSLAYVMPPERSVDIDTEIDWKLAELLHQPEAKS